MSDKHCLFPLDEIMSQPEEYFAQLVKPTVESSFAEAASTAKIMAAFIFLHQMKDWAKHGGIISGDESDYWQECPFANIIMEIATGAKHQFVSDKKAAKDPTVLRFRKISGYGRGVYGKGPYSAPNFQVEGRRFKHENPTWHSMKAVMEEPCMWWQNKLANG